MKNAISPRSPKNESPTKKKKLTIFEILENPKYRKFFKTFATREYAIENILFYEEVQRFKDLNENERKIRFLDIMDLFIDCSSEFSINTSKKLIDKMKEKVEDCPCEMFDEILDNLIAETLSNVYYNFLVSNLYEEMIMSNSSSFKAFYIFSK